VILLPEVTTSNFDNYLLYSQQSCIILTMTMTVIINREQVKYFLDKYPQQQ